MPDIKISFENVTQNGVDFLNEQITRLLDLITYEDKSEENTLRLITFQS